MFFKLRPRAVEMLRPPRNLNPALEQGNNTGHRIDKNLLCKPSFYKIIFKATVWVCYHFIRYPTLMHVLQEHFCQDENFDTAVFQF